MTHDEFFFGSEIMVMLIEFDFPTIHTFLRFTVFMLVLKTYIAVIIIIMIAIEYVLNANLYTHSHNMHDWERE